MWLIWRRLKIIFLKSHCKLFSEDTVRQGEAWFNERISYAQAVTTGFKSVDIVIRDVNKRTGLEALCQTFNMDKSEIVAFWR